MDYKKAGSRWGVWEGGGPVHCIHLARNKAQCRDHGKRW